MKRNGEQYYFIERKSPQRGGACTVRKDDRTFERMFTITFDEHVLPNS